MARIRNLYLASRPPPQPAGRPPLRWSVWEKIRLLVNYKPSTGTVRRHSYRWLSDRVPLLCHPNRRLRRFFLGQLQCKANELFIMLNWIWLNRLETSDRRQKMISSTKFPKVRAFQDRLQLPRSLALTLLPLTLKSILKRAKESKQAIREWKWKTMKRKTATSKWTFRVSFNLRWTV